MRLATSIVAVCLIYSGVAESGDTLSNFKCTFEHSECPITVDSKTWKVTPAHLSLFEPPNDHTLGNINGHYLSFTNQTGVSKAVIEIPLELENTKKCLELWYQVNSYRTKDMHLKVYFLAGYDPETCIQEKKFTMHPEWPIQETWRKYSTNLPDETVVVELRADVSKNHGAVVLDDIRVYDCGTPSPPSDLLDCDFERDMCGFHSDEWAEIPWKRGRADYSNTTSGGRPNHDHTTGNGSYVYLESTNISVTGDQGRLITPEFNVSGDAPYCFQFYFFSYFLTKELFVYNVAKQNHISTVWNTTVNDKVKGAWEWVIAPLPVGRTQLSIAMQVKEGLAGKAGLAIDDLRIMRCPVVTKSPPEKQSYLNQLSCDFTKPHSCELVNNGVLPAKWVRVSGANVTKPSCDAKGNKKGYFMFLNSTHRQRSFLGQGSTTFGMMILTEQLEVFNNWCVDFSYYVFGSSKTVVPRHANLTVGLMKEQGTTIIFRANKTYVDQWQHSGNIKLQSGIQGVLFFNGSFVDDGKTVIAIDDLFIGPCKMAVETTTAPYTTATTINTTDVSIATNATVIVTTATTLNTTDVSIATNATVIVTTPTTMNTTDVTIATNATIVTTERVTTSAVTNVTDVPITVTAANSSHTWNPTTAPLTTTGEITTTHKTTTHSGGDRVELFTMFFLIPLIVFL